MLEAINRDDPVAAGRWQYKQQWADRIAAVGGTGRSGHRRLTDGRDAAAGLVRRPIRAHLGRGARRRPARFHPQHLPTRTAPRPVAQLARRRAARLGRVGSARVGALFRGRSRRLRRPRRGGADFRRALHRAEAIAPADKGLWPGAPRVRGAGATADLGRLPGRVRRRAPGSVVRSEGVEGVFFTGWHGHEELPTGLGCADVFVSPSVGEAFGQVFIEAMACGLPVIAAASGGPLSFVNDVEGAPNGWLVEPPTTRCRSRRRWPNPPPVRRPRRSARNVRPTR